MRQQSLSPHSQLPPSSNFLLSAHTHSAHQMHSETTPKNLIKSQDLSSPDIKTPKSKRPYKLSKTNPETLSPSKNKDAKVNKNSPDKQKNLNQLFGHWNLQENKRYHWFLEAHFSHFMNRSMRRMDRIFTSMAKFVGTRQAEQCRSHHQKMEKKHKSFGKILLNLRLSHYETGEFDAMLKEMEENDVDVREGVLSYEALENGEGMEMLTPKSTISSPGKRVKWEEGEMGEMEKIQFGEEKMEFSEKNEFSQEKYEFSQEKMVFGSRESIGDMQSQQMGQQNEQGNKSDHKEFFSQGGQLMQGVVSNLQEWGLQLQSSKNYYYRLQMMQEKKIQQENLLDPDYDNKLDLHNILFS